MCTGWTISQKCTRVTDRSNNVLEITVVYNKVIWLIHLCMRSEFGFRSRPAKNSTLTNLENSKRLYNYAQWPVILNRNTSISRKIRVSYSIMYARRKYKLLFAAESYMPLFFFFFFVTNAIAPILLVATFAKFDFADRLNYIVAIHRTVLNSFRHFCVLGRFAFGLLRLFLHWKPISFPRDTFA